jgi:hypothetical protein
MPCDGDGSHDCASFFGVYMMGHVSVAAKAAVNSAKYDKK